MSPEVERLAGRLAQAPSVFVVAEDDLVLAAIVSDLFRVRSGAPLNAAGLELFRSPARDKGAQRHRALVLITTWLLYDETFQGAEPARMLALLRDRVPALAAAAMPRLFVEDAERREELVRMCFAELGIVPPGETAAVAEDRLATLDSVKRREVLAAAREREEKRERKRRELERLKAQEDEERRKAARTTHED